VGEHPGRAGHLLEALVEARSSGVGGVISVVERPLDAGLLRRAKLEAMHLPVRDYEAPTLEQLEEAVAFIAAVRGRGEAVFIHCYAGIGRSATVACAYLVTLGATADQAIAQVRRRRSPVCVESAAQVAVIEAFAAARGR
jgi:atypical dual specificity phosphatase